MNISRNAQRVLHVLGQGGRIVARKEGGRKVIAVDCFTREGWRLGQCDLDTFRHLRAKRLIRSRNGAPYRISERGLQAVRPQLDNQ